MCTLILSKISVLSSESSGFTQLIEELIGIRMASTNFRLIDSRLILEFNISASFDVTLNKDFGWNFNIFSV